MLKHDTERIQEQVSNLYSLVEVVTIRIHTSLEEFENGVFPL